MQACLGARGSCVQLLTSPLSLTEGGGGAACLQFLALTELADPVKGYLVDDTLVIEAQLILWNDMENMDSEAVTFNVRGEPFTVLKSSLQVRRGAVVCTCFDPRDSLSSAWCSPSIRFCAGVSRLSAVQAS
jgi:hypothetical protein